MDKDTKPTEKRKSPTLLQSEVVVSFIQTHEMPRWYFEFWGGALRTRWVAVPLDGSGIPLAISPEASDEQA